MVTLFTCMQHTIVLFALICKKHINLTNHQHLCYYIGLLILVYMLSEIISAHLNFGQRTTNAHTPNR